MKLHRKRAPPPRRQSGATLMIVMFVTALAIFTVLIAKLSPTTQKADQLSGAASAQLEGKNALLGYLRVNDPDAWGLLPLPDMGKRDSSPHVETESTANFGADPARGLLANELATPLETSLIGKFPAKTLGTRALRDPSGNCLWYALSAAFKITNKKNAYVPIYNWDTLGDFETGLSDNPHESRAVALIFTTGTPGNGQSRTPSGFDSVYECGGNYVVGNYLEIIVPASATTDTNQAVYPVVPQAAPVAPPAAAITIAHPASSGASTDHLLAITSQEIFQQILPTGKTQAAINLLLPLLKGCLEPQNLPTTGLSAISSGTTGNARYVGPLPTSTDCSTTIKDANAKELLRWRDNFWYLACQSPLRDCISLVDAASLVAPQSCDGLIVFSGARTTAQRRSNATEKATPAQYLETALNAFASADQTATLARLSVSANPDEITQDAAECLKRPSELNKVELDDFQDVTPTYAEKPLVSRDIDTDILTLGNPDVPTASLSSSAVGCSFSGNVFAFGNGARFYFQFQIETLGDGFVFALIDAETNVNSASESTAKVCGGEGNEGEYLGYAGRNLDKLEAGKLISPPINWPKIGLEFDTVQNKAAVNDSTNSHIALVYWGRSHDWPDPQPPSSFEDDNTHKAPAQPQAGYQDPFADSAHGVAMRKSDPSLRRFHVRYDITRNYNASAGSAQYVSKIWIRPIAEMIPGMDNVNQDFSTISGVKEDHKDTIQIVNPVAGTETFRLFRFGFTNAQSSRSQKITIQDLRARSR